MMERPNAVFINGEAVQLCEYIKDRLYFVTIASRKEPKSTADIHFFSIDDELVYSNYYNDFGPLNLGCLYRYCVKLNTKLKCFSLGKKQIIHYTSTDPQKRANAAFLIASFSVIYLKMTPKQAYKPLMSDKYRLFRPFQDASIGASEYHIYMVDCLDGIYRALQHGFFNFEDFDLEEYERYEKIEYGDLNWIIPNKFLAFCGPSNETNTSYKPPEHYINYFKQNDVSTIIRLNRKTYNSRSFTKAGFNHYDLYFVDGSVPSLTLANKFLEICESVTGAIAVHCKAGLGRTGSLIGTYMMKHYRMTARECIAWLRICRPGSVIGRQQAWLEEMQGVFWRSGDIYRVRRHGDGDCIPRHTYGIYSIVARKNKEGLQNLDLLPQQIVPYNFNVERLNTGNCLKHLLGRTLPENQSMDDYASVPNHGKKCLNKKSRLNPFNRYNNQQGIVNNRCFDSPCQCIPVPIPRKMHTIQSGRSNFMEHSKNINLCDPSGFVNNLVSSPQMTQGDRLNAIKIIRAKQGAGDKMNIGK
ncbi:Dual specificity protein phosphatase CDC14A [Blattella germanica]|nr:Dual specificity protein phosphatase CDC14A [Blattella germanica]